MTFWGKWISSSQLVGLDIGSHSLKVATLRPKKSTYEVIQMATLGLPHGTIVDGDILDAFTLEEALKELFVREKIKSRDVAFALSGNSVISKRISIPTLSVSELEDQISIIAAQYIPFPVNEMKVDYQMLPSSEKEAQKIDLMIVAAKQRFLDSYLTVVQAADLKPVAIETTASALTNLYSILRRARNATSPQDSHEKQTVALIHLGACLSQLILIENDAAVFTRDLAVGGNLVTEDLQEKLKLSFPEAEALKINSYKEKNIPKETVEVIDQSCQRICHDIQQTLNLYISQHPETDIEKLFICGGTSKIVPLRKWIEEKTGLETVALNPFDVILYDTKKWDEGSMDALQAIAAVSLGLATRSLKD